MTALEKNSLRGEHIVLTLFTQSTSVSVMRSLDSSRRALPGTRDGGGAQDDQERDLDQDQRGHSGAKAKWGQKGSSQIAPVPHQL